MKAGKRCAFLEMLNQATGRAFEARLAARKVPGGSCLPWAM